MWVETVFPHISENAGLNLLAVDLLGFGKSPKPMDCLYRLKDHLDMIEKSLIEPFHLESFHLVAHSMGCTIALALAAKYPKHIKSITLVGVVSEIAVEQRGNRYISHHANHMLFIFFF